MLLFVSEKLHAQERDVLIVEKFQQFVNEL